MKYFNEDYPTQDGPASSCDIPLGDIVYNTEEIETCIELLYWRALESGEMHSGAMMAGGRGACPHAYQSSVPYNAIEIILQLQEEVRKLKEPVDK